MRADLLWLTGLLGCALCLAAHVRRPGPRRGLLPGTVALGAMLLAAPGAPVWQLRLGCLAALTALATTYLRGCPHHAGLRADLAVMAAVTAAMLQPHAAHLAADPAGRLATGAFVLLGRLLLHAGAHLVRLVRTGPPPHPEPGRALAAAGGLLMVTGMAFMPM
jgi:hypothetical protein